MERLGDENGTTGRPGDLTTAGTGGHTDPLKASIVRSDSSMMSETVVGSATLMSHCLIPPDNKEDSLEQQDVEARLTTTGLGKNKQVQTVFSRSTLKAIVEDKALQTEKSGLDQKELSKFDIVDVTTTTTTTKIPPSSFVHTVANGPTYALKQNHRFQIAAEDMGNAMASLLEDTILDWYDAEKIRSSKRSAMKFFALWAAKIYTPSSKSICAHLSQAGMTKEKVKTLVEEHIGEQTTARQARGILAKKEPSLCVKAACTGETKQEVHNGTEPEVLKTISLLPNSCLVPTHPSASAKPTEGGQSYLREDDAGAVGEAFRIISQELLKKDEEIASAKPKQESQSSLQEDDASPVGEAFRMISQVLLEKNGEIATLNIKLRAKDETISKLSEESVKEKENTPPEASALCQASLERSDSSEASKYDWMVEFLQDYLDLLKKELATEKKSHSASQCELEKLEHALDHYGKADSICDRKKQEPEDAQAPTVTCLTESLLSPVDILRKEVSEVKKALQAEKTAHEVTKRGIKDCESSRSHMYWQYS